ncbi:putative F-box protein [Sesamum alatum]|uniref:F-box protein n=1 Tax=Sesamum alatum TaxID=300844 RepID=A0AAE1YBH5_9LAMI|nr:putative F-box protein [Sesamum alatum]
MDTIGKQYSLPEDIIIDILLVLPVKSLLRCESVCKQWYAIIGSSMFINKHFHHESNHTRLLIFRRHNHSLGKPSDPEDNTFALFLDEALQIREQPKKSHIPYAIRSLHGPCKDVFCIRNSNHQLALWNTATRRFDYARVPQFSIYTSKTDSWRCFENKTILDVHDFVADPEHGTTFLNGFYYWRKRIDLRESFLLALDMHNEVFQEIQLPCSLRRGTINLHLCNESIVAFGRFGEFESKVPNRHQLCLFKPAAALQIAAAATTARPLLSKLIIALQNPSSPSAAQIRRLKRRRTLFLHVS